jgi:hypothetical protein
LRSARTSARRHLPDLAWLARKDLDHHRKPELVTLAGLLANDPLYDLQPARRIANHRHRLPALSMRFRLRSPLADRDQIGLELPAALDRQADGIRLRRT